MQIAEWQKRGAQIQVSINLTANNLVEQDLVHRIHTALILHQVSPSMLEIECLETQTLIQDISSDNKSKVIVKSMIDMAHPLSYHVVAEGVEDNDTLQCLEELQSDSVQGFYFSRPLQHDQILEWSKPYI